MSERYDDPMHDLRHLWRQLESPSPDGPGDEATRASVAWAQAAWKTMTPAPGVCQVRRRRRLRPVLLLPVAMPIAVAAALLIWSGVGERATEPTHPSPASLTASAPMRAHPVADGSLELRRGRVRLILIDHQPTEDS